jgi:MFS family permease
VSADADATAGPVAGRRSVRPLAGVLAAMLVAMTGTRVSAIALPWFVLVTTGSATKTGLAAFCEMAPYVLAKALSGPVLDRIGTRLVSWTADLASAVAAALVPVCYLLGMLPFWALLALVAVIGMVRGPGDLAKQVMVPEAADRSRVPLERATGLSGATERLASTVGPVAGGALIALTSPMTGLAVNAVCFALGSLVVAIVLPRGMGGRPKPDTTVTDTDPAPTATDATPTGATAPPATGAPARDGYARDGYWRRLADGARFIRGDRLLLAIAVLVAVTNLLDAAFVSVMLPVWAERSGNGPQAIGLLGGTMGGTAIAGSLIAATVAHRMPRGPVLLLGNLAAGAPRFLVLASDAPMWALVAVFGVSGFGAGFLNPIIGAAIFERIPRPLLGRVTSLVASMAWAGMPLGALVGGVGVTALGLAPVLVISGGLYAVAAVLLGIRPEWRRMDAERRRRAVEPERRPTSNHRIVNGWRRSRQRRAAG